MFLVKFTIFSITLTLAASTADYQEIEGIKRSAVCLIERVATHNHVTAKFQKVGQEQKNGTTLIACKLELGTEEYAANSTSLAMAKEKVSRQAYALTKYQKPPLGNRTCIVHHPTAKSDISLLEEYAQLLHSHVLYAEKARNPNGTFECDATLNDKSGSGIGHSKKLAKTVAATQLLAVIGRKKVIDALTAKYNKPEYHNMEPMVRLRKIVRVTELNGDATYTKQREVSEGAGKRIVAQVLTSEGMSTGSGATYEEACSNAAANFLRNFLRFTVTHSFHPAAH